MAFEIESAEVRIEVTGLDDLAAKLAVADGQIKAFGRSASNSVGGSGVAKDTEKLGIDVENAGKKADKASKDFEKLGKGIGNTLGGVPLAGGFSKPFQDMFKWVGQAGDQLAKFGTRFGNFLSGLGGGIPVVSQFGSALSDLTPLLGALPLLLTGVVVAALAWPTALAAATFAVTALADGIGILVAALGAVAIGAAAAAVPIALFGAGLLLAFKHIDENKLQHVKDDFNNLSDAVSKRFAPAINDAITDVGKLTDFFTNEVKNKSFGQIVADSFTKGLPAINHVVGQITGAIANPFRDVMKFVFGQGGGADQLEQQLSNWADRANSFFLGHNKLIKIPATLTGEDGGSILDPAHFKRVHIKGVLDFAKDWFDSLHLTDLGMNIAHSILSAIGASGLGDAITGIFHDAMFRAVNAFRQALGGQPIQAPKTTSSFLSGPNNPRGAPIITPSVAAPITPTSTLIANAVIHVGSAILTSAFNTSANGTPIPQNGTPQGGPSPLHPIARAAFIGKGIEKLVWSDFIKKVVWTEFIEKLVWGDFIKKVVWNNTLGKVDWGHYISKLKSWGTWITKVDWGSYIAKIKSWGSWITKINWSALIPSFDWSDFIPHLSWPSIPSFPGWSSLIGHIASGTNSTGLQHAAAGWGRYMVGEAGPEIVTLPNGSAVTPNWRLNQRRGSGGGGTTVNLTIPTVFPADSRVKRELHRYINELMDTHSRHKLADPTYTLGI